MFGKGIYFADMFQKSWAYTHDNFMPFNSWNQKQDKSQIEEFKSTYYMLLCEVALGNSK